jgi:drug/metabolite transporter (DMT)-like permease
MYFFALREEDTSPVAAIGSAYPIFSFVVFIFFGTASFSISVVFGILLVATGLFLMQAKKSGQGGIKKKAFLLGVGSSIAWGLWGFLDYQALQYGSPFDLMFWTSVFLLILSTAVLIVLLLKKRSIKIKKEAIFYRLGASFNSSIALLAFYFALSKTTSPEEIVAITATYPIVTMLLAVSLKEESFYLKRALAISAVVVGIILLYM